MERSEFDLELLAGIEDRAKTVRTRIRSVVFGYTHAFCLYGPAGHGKSHIVTSELDETLGSGKCKQYKGEKAEAAVLSVWRS